MNVYLDHAATKPLSENMKEYLAGMLDIYGNPSSLHSAGCKARKIIAESRGKAADFIHSETENIYFTCGGSASNTLGIKGFIQKNRCDVFYSPTAHKSILKIMEGIKAVPLKVDKTGRIDINDMERMIAGRAPFVIIDYSNSEIGTIQDVGDIIDTVHFYKGVVYLDCTGSIPTIPIDVKKLDADIIGFSAHKLGGLKGCGVLYKKKNIQLEPLVYGSQEQGLCSGTENLLGIASLGEAVRQTDYSSVSSENRDYVYHYIMKNIHGCYLVGAPIDSGRRLPHNLYMCFKGIEGESLMILLDMNGIQVSTGSACSSGDLAPPAVLSAVGMEDRDLHSCIRMTFSGSETKEEIHYVCETLNHCADVLRKINK